jgi:trk system potassium uptake protein
VVLMFIGRLGPITLASALALRENSAATNYPRSDPSLAKTIPQDRVVVIGLGRFGSSLAYELVRHGTQVLAIDSDPRLVQAHSEEITHAAIADSTDPVALQQLGVADFPCAVVGIGTDIEASILTTSALSDLGVPQIWAEATTPQQQRILESVGAHHVVLPEHDMGERVAHLVTGRLLDYIEFGDDYAIVKTRTLDRWHQCSS